MAEIAAVGSIALVAAPWRRRNRRDAGKKATAPKQRSRAILLRRPIRRQRQRRRLYLPDATGVDRARVRCRDRAVRYYLVGLVK